MSSLAVAGPILTPGPAGSWDSSAVSCPIVLRDDDGYQMWYYGREHGFPGFPSSGEVASLPMGRTGLAASPDGMHWTRVAGRGTLGSVFDPNPRPGRFDSFMVGASDVVRTSDGYRMYYVGARDSAGLLLGRPVYGFPVAVGLAVSADGLGFERLGDDPILEAGDGWDSEIAGFARVLAVPGGWRMYYHSIDATGAAVGVAESSDGIRWERRGRVFGGSGDPGRFDAHSVNARHVIPWKGGYLMAYEALDGQGEMRFRLGLATSADGLTWDRQPGSGQGGCLIDLGGPGSFDEWFMSMPYLVPVGETLRLYYVGFDGQRRTSIGCLEILNGSWRRIGAPSPSL